MNNQLYLLLLNYVNILVIRLLVFPRQRFHAQDSKTPVSARFDTSDLRLEASHTDVALLIY
jgi:hypothetical protein